MGQQPLYFNGVEMGDESASLAEYSVTPDDFPGGPIVQLGRSPWCPYDVYVELSDGRAHKVWVSSCTTVAQLRGQVSGELGIPYLMMQMSCGGETLRDRFTLGDYSVPANAKIDLTTAKPLYAGPKYR